MIPPSPQPLSREGRGAYSAFDGSSDCPGGSAVGIAVWSRTVYDGHALTGTSDLIGSMVVEGERSFLGRSRSVGTLGRQSCGVASRSSPILSEPMRGGAPPGLGLSLSADAVYLVPLARPSNSLLRHVRAVKSVGQDRSG
jgi:hypothetical protein